MNQSTTLFPDVPMGPLIDGNGGASRRRSCLRLAKSRQGRVLASPISDASSSMEETACRSVK